MDDDLSGVSDRVLLDLLAEVALYRDALRLAVEHPDWLDAIAAELGLLAEERGSDGHADLSPSRFAGGAGNGALGV